MRKGASNNLYVQDRMERNGSDFEGSGACDGRYDARYEKAERRKAARLPLLFLLGILFCLALNIYMSGEELYYYLNGNVAVAEYTDNKEYASWITPNGTKNFVSTAWAAQKGDTVRVYYLGEDYSGARAMSGALVWAGFYGFFGLLLALDIYWLYRIFHKTHHSVTKN